MVSIRRLTPLLATLRTCMLLPPVAVAIGWLYRNVEVVSEPAPIARPKLTAQDAKVALVEMLRREAVRDPERCREVWGSTEGG